MTSAPLSSELAARLAYRQRVAEVEEQLHDIVRTRWTRSKAQGQKTIWGLRGKEIRSARQELEYLLKHEERKSGLNSPAVYGAEIKRRCEVAKKTLEAMPRSTPQRRDQLPPVIEQLAAIIDNLAEGEREIEAARSGAASPA